MQQYSQIIKKKFSLPVLGIVILFLFPYSVNAQNYYWVFLKDKSAEGFNPSSYFDISVIERKKSEGKPVFDYADLPVNKKYLEEIGFHVKKICFESRWLNAIKVDASEKELKKISSFPFVSGTVKASKGNLEIASKLHKRDWKKLDERGRDDLLRRQLSVMQGNLFAEKKLDGKGIRIAILDIGYSGVNKNAVFKDIRDEGRILKTWDFVRNHENVYGHDTHGCTVLSCIAGKTEKGNTGLATKAEFLLAITETIGEEFFEEENWLAAMEWAYRNGARIISSSLGYTYHRYYTSDLDGKTSLVARAANMAASKGMLVVNAMGNDGDNSWQFMGTPADADSIISVAGIDPTTELHIEFSSFGPTSDLRRKPNVAAFGEVIGANRKNTATEYGTSFSTPLVSGFAACLWQLHPEMNNMQIFHELERCGNLFPYFDYAHGFGIPQASKALKPDSTKTPSFEFEVKEGKLQVRINVFVEDTGEINHSDSYLFYHIMNKEGYLDKYAVIKVHEKVPFSIYLDEISEERILRVSYRGFTAEYKIVHSI